MDNIFLKPALREAGGVARVRDPQTGAPLAADGEWKARSQYWTRRLRDGDVVEAQPLAVAMTAVLPPISPAALVKCPTCSEPAVCEQSARCALN
ncbi:DUF2635 domain-containing protein [Bradyrhizobium sp. SZCCHNR3013]|uniref:DUF2635 domain-containing protein n=1 Tax=unclassified Bradyrhizobium TaxID=2631580 RepID=UPI00396798D2